MTPEHVAQAFRQAHLKLDTIIMNPQSAQPKYPGTLPVIPAFIMTLEQSAQLPDLSAAELEESKRAALVTTEAMNNFILLETLIKQKTTDMNAIQQAMSLKNLDVMADPVYKARNQLLSDAEFADVHGLRFLNCLLAVSPLDVKYMQLLTNLTQKMHKLVENPTVKAHHDALTAGIQALQSELEFNPVSHAFYTAGRAFIGALGCLLGAVMMLIGLATLTGPIAGLVTKGDHWGPITIGKQLIMGSIHFMFGGPTKGQREEAQTLASHYAKTIEKADALETAITSNPTSKFV